MEDTIDIRAARAAGAALDAGRLTLHPNLARIAVEYVRVAERCHRGEIDVVAANSLIRDLVARDDDGVQWSINPRDGGWVFRSRLGEMVAAAPPTYGLATLTAYDMSRAVAATANPDDVLVFRQVAEPDTGGLVGSTRRRPRSAAQHGRRPLVWVIAVAVVVAGIAGVAHVRNQPDREPAVVTRPSGP